jgi:hypothetical protein
VKIVIAGIYCLLFLALSANAQETIEKTQKLIDGNKEAYHVLKANPQVKQGMYRVRHKNKIVVSGMYDQNKRTGMWHYFDSKGNLLQNYNFDNHQLNYEAPDSISNFRYIYDQNIKPTDRVTKPVRIGGRYYGYFPYINLFKSMESSMDIRNLRSVIFEFLVSPGGNLADYKIYLNYLITQKILSADITHLSPDDKCFLPATINYEPVSSRIRITRRVVNGEFVF